MLNQVNLDEKRITKEWLKKFLRKEFKLYYTTPSLNDCLYLHYKGFPKIENLEEFTGLKVIYLEGNGISKIEGLEALVNLRCLYLQENLIKKIENLEMLQNLVILNLTDNCIEKIENLQACTKLQTLQIKRNRIGMNGLTDLEGIIGLPELSVLDISDNKIEDINVIGEVFEKMPALAVLYFQNNPAIKFIKNYRKVLINNIKTLKYIDDRPVFPDERRFAEAFILGGTELERSEREKYKKEQEDEHMRNHLAFRNMITKYQEEAKQQQHQAQQNNDGQVQQQNVPIDVEISAQSSDSENDSSKTYTHLSTYNSQTNQLPSEESEQQSAQSKSKEISRNSSRQSLQSEDIQINKVEWVMQQEEGKFEVQQNSKSQDLDELD